MVRLCTHHQKQFIRVLNDIYTEVQPDSEGQQSSESESMEASTCGSGCSQRSTENQDKGAACTESRPPSSSEPGHSGSDGSLHVAGQAPKQPTELKSTDRAESPSPALRRDFSDPPVARLCSASPKDSSTQGYLSTLNSSSLNFHHAAKNLEGQVAGHEQEAGVRKCEDNKEQMAGKALVEGYISVKVANVNGSEDSLDGCLGSQKSSFRALPEEPWDPGFAVSPPRRADKENTLQCGSKASLHQDLDAKEQDARPKPENHLHAVAKGKAGCHLHPADKGPLDKSKEGWLPAGTAPATHRAPGGHPRAKAASLRSSRKSKKASGLRINDYDNQCDVVYISQPITECHFESQRSVSSRRTARKSTRGYFFNGECCELPTVRTLVKSSRAEERGGSPALRTEALVSTKPALVLSGGGSSGTGRDGEKRVSLRLLAKGAPASRETKARGDLGCCPAGAAGHAGAALAGSCRGQCPCSPSPLLPARRRRTAWLAHRPQAPPAAKGPGTRPPRRLAWIPSGDSGSKDRSAVQAASFAALPAAEAAIREEGSPGSGVQTIPDLPASPEPGSPLQPSAAPDAAPLADAGPRDPAELPGAGGAEPCGVHPTEPSPPSPDLQAPEQPPATEGGDCPPELPAAFQCVDVNKSVDAEPEAELLGVLGDSSLEEEEAVPASTALPAVSEGEAVQNNSPAGEKEPAEGEMLPEPDGLETADKDSVSSKDSLDKKRKKGRRTLVASDRRLRSQQSQSPAEGSAEDAGSSSSMQLPCLQIKLSKSPSAKRFKREVQLDGAASVHFPNDCFHTTLLKTSEEPSTGQALESITEQQPGEESGVITRQTYKSILAKETVAEGENSSEDDPPAKGGHSQPGETLEMCVQADAEQTSILLPAESSVPADDAEQAEVKPGGTRAKEEESPDSAMDTGKLESYEPAASSPPCPSSRASGSKHLPAKAAKPKKSALQFYNLRHTPAPTDTAKKSTPGKESMQAIPKPRDECSSGNDDSLALEDADLADSKPKFMEWCAEEENQELIAEFNAQYMKVQKGWIQLEKEVQPTPKVKNKADKLKEIWKSKKRTRKSRGSLEVQKLSPVQMLFMKAFKLSDICQWFLETTETRSLVIVKKLNTRLPGEIPPIKVPMQKYSSSGLYPSSLQAERLKKHLKKFAAATPARNNLKNQKLWAKIRENADRAEPPSEAGPEEASQDRSVVPTPSLPTQASTRILRKYSNLRGKLRAQHRAALESKPSRKSVCINPLMSPKLALQIKADAFPGSIPGDGLEQEGEEGEGQVPGGALAPGRPCSSRREPRKGSWRRCGSPCGRARRTRAGGPCCPPATRSWPSPRGRSPSGNPRQRSQKMANKKPGAGKTLTRSMKKMQESSGAQGKRKLRAKVDCSHSKRSRLDTKIAKNR
uniref:Ligand dependent nuclear receptor corepressor n=1 Tax=Anas platyrhynchos TaxID=8839 RepID=A0A8B9Z9M2_ANAPL